jgi:hypothetical protein
MASYKEMKEAGIDPALIPDHLWQNVKTDGGVLTQKVVLQEPLEGVPSVEIYRQVNLFEEEILRSNREQYDTDQKFSRKGELDAKVASIPLNIFYRDQRIQEGIKGDRDAMKSWLNDDNNRIYRTIKGKI